MQGGLVTTKRSKEAKEVWQDLQVLRDDIQKVYAMTDKDMKDGMGACTKLRRMEPTFWADNEPQTYASAGTIGTWQEYMQGCSTLNLVKIGLMALQSMELYAFYSKLAVGMVSDSQVNIMVGAQVEMLITMYEKGELRNDEVTRLLKVESRRAGSLLGEKVHLRACRYFKDGGCMAGAECPYMHL